MANLYLPVVAANISAYAQVLLKYGMLAHEPIVLSSSGMFAPLLGPLLSVALAMYAVAMLLWLQVLAKILLSVAYPMLAVTYAIVPVLATIFFEEKIGEFHFLGIAFVLLGVAIIGGNHE